MADHRFESEAYWDRIRRPSESRPFGDSTTYQLGAEFIGELPVEDWGCGLGWYRRFAQGPYCGVDGPRSVHADKVADLREYRSQTPALFMRRVFEYNPFEWQIILDNAVASFTHRMVLVIFTPFSDFTIMLKGDPEISFAWSDVTDRFGDVPWSSQTVASKTQHHGTKNGIENVFYLEK